MKSKKTKNSKTYNDYEKNRDEDNLILRTGERDEIVSRFFKGKTKNIDKELANVLIYDERRKR